jgi:hypothetical protein
VLFSGALEEVDAAARQRERDLHIVLARDLTAPNAILRRKSRRCFIDGRAKPAMTKGDVR